MSMTRRIPRRKSILNVGPLFPNDDAVLLWVVCRDFPIRSLPQSPFYAYGMARCGKNASFGVLDVLMLRRDACNRLSAYLSTNRTTCLSTARHHDTIRIPTSFNVG